MAKTAPAPPRGVATENTTIGASLPALAGSLARRTAISTGRGALTYGELGDLVERYTRHESALSSLPPVSVVACQSADPIRIVTLVYACAELGLIVCPLDPRLRPAERAALLAVAAPRLTVDDGSNDWLNPIPGRRISPRPAVDCRTLFYLGFTAGSTGLPKGVLRTQASWAISFARMTGEFGLSADDQILVPGPLTHSFFLTGALHGLSVGASVHCLEKFTPGRLRDSIERVGATALYLVPTMARRLADELERSGPLIHPRTVVIAGAPWYPEERRRLQPLLPNARLIQYYGSSEMGFVSIAGDEEFRQAPASVGRPFSGVEIAIRDELGADLPAGSVGCIWARSPLTFGRYAQEPSGTPLRSEELAWVSSGDVGWISEGFLYVEGRGDQLVNVGGQKVSTAEIERALLEHPLVTEAVVCGLDHPYLGEVVAAAVEVGNQLSPQSGEIRAWLRRRVSAHKAPRVLVSVPALPHTSSGKVARVEVREMLLAEARKGKRPSAL